jgi:hypothetical protein
MEVRLIGKFEDVEAVTRDLRRLFTVVSERDLARRSGEGIRRYLVVVFTPETEARREGV